MLAQKSKENINRRAVFVIVAIERWASFYRIYDRQNVPASDISRNRPIWTWISMIEMQSNVLERDSSHLLPICTAPFLSTNVFSWGVSRFQKWNFSNSNIYIRIFAIGIANRFYVWECRKIDEPNIENRIVIDHSEAETYFVFPN